VKPHSRDILNEWLRKKEWTLADFQHDSIDAVLSGKSGLLNADTGMGKTYAMFLPALLRFIDANKDYQTKINAGTRVLWITPLRALTKDLQRNMMTACEELSVPWKVGVRTGDVSVKDKLNQKKQMPETLIITPESLHLLFTQKNWSDYFRKLEMIVVDEWHELLGTKRGVQTELALAHLKSHFPQLQIWGISATIGNLNQALDVLLGVNHKEAAIIRSKRKKKVEVTSVLPDEIERLPWAGYLGVHLLDKVMDIVEQSETTLLFTNTRSQTEIWYRAIMEKRPDLAGLVALHHGSLEREIRTWVEEALHNEKLKLVICTSSLDLGVDFRPVDTVIQVGSPKSVSRFLQRAGRSGHQPGAVSKIHFVPTHALELVEAVSLREGVERNNTEDRVTVVNSFDVLAQYLVTLATGDGFEEQKLFEEVKKTFAYQFITREDWEWLLGFVTTGGPTLLAYDEFKKVEREGDLFKVKERRIAMRHRLSMGTIVSDSSLRVKYLSGKYLGTIEENFISRLKPGDAFWFAGMNLEFIRVREMTAQVRKAGSKKASVPRWMGGRIPLSSALSAYIRKQFDGIARRNDPPREIKRLMPILQLQEERSAIPHENQLLIEQCTTREGYHLFFFPFEGRLVHEGMASVVAYRISRFFPISFSIAMNDYGFELLSDREVDIAAILKEHNLFSTENLLNDIQSSINSTEMARRKFREIASIAGLIFQGYPGRKMKTKHLQASSSLFFDVILENEPNHLLIRQAFQEVLDQQLEEERLRKTLMRIGEQEIIIRQTGIPTPLAFPILVDRTREQLTSEKLEDRINKIIRQYEQFYESKN
jgi:ATP-dependent Lhr-like helicase